MDENLIQQRTEAMIDEDLLWAMLTAIERTATLTTGPAHNWATILKLTAIEGAQRWSPPGVLTRAVDLYCDPDGPASLDYVDAVGPPGITDEELGF